MDQAEPEGQIIRRHQQECCADANLDCNVWIINVCVFDPSIHQIPIEVEAKHAAAKYSADCSAVKVNGTAVIPFIEIKICSPSFLLLK